MPILTIPLLISMYIFRWATRREPHLNMWLSLYLYVTNRHFSLSLRYLTYSAGSQFLVRDPGVNIWLCAICVSCPCSRFFFILPFPIIINHTDTRYWHRCKYSVLVQLWQFAHLSEKLWSGFFSDQYLLFLEIKLLQPDSDFKFNGPSLQLWDSFCPGHSRCTFIMKEKVV